MSPVIIISGYILIGFIVATLVFKVFPPDTRPYADDSDVFLFVMATILWPVGFAVLAAYVPITYLKEYVSYLKKTANSG